MNYIAYAFYAFILMSIMACNDRSPQHIEIIKNWNETCSKSCESIGFKADLDSWKGCQCSTETIDKK